MRYPIVSGTLAAVVALGVGAASPSAGAQELNEFTAQGGAWRLFTKNCSGCHGIRGQGIQPLGPPLMGNPLVVNAPADAIKAVIRNGREGEAKAYGEYLQNDQLGYMSMPPFEYDIITDRELDLLVNYLQGDFQDGEFNER